MGTQPSELARTRHAAIVGRSADAALDPLTGLPGREALVAAFDALAAAPPALDPDCSAALLHVALDHFAETNQRVGRSIADGVLIEVAHRLRAAVGRDASVVRLGGDEFAVLLTRPSDRADVVLRADAVIRALGRPVRLDQEVVVDGTARRSVSVGACVGVACIEAAELAAGALDEVLRRADLAVQRAKGRGRGRVEHFDAIAVLDARADRVLQARRATECRLRTAIDEGGLEIHLQPQVELPSGRITGYEALARWDDPLLGRIPPDEFIPLAESSGLILELGSWVLRTSCRQAVALPVHDEHGPVMAVNVSPLKLAQPGFVELVVATLAETGLPAHRLCLELTETAAIEDLPQTSSHLSELRDLGVEIALDDFGTGYSSLTLLRSLPLSVVKIDRSFVESVARSAQDAVLVRMVIEAAHSFGLKVCAEGVEDADQARQLVAMGCDAAQGFYFGRPVPLAHHLGTAVASMPPGFDLFAAPPIPLGAADAMVVVTDPAATIVYASSTSTLLIGWTPQQLVGTNAADYLHPDAVRGDNSPLKLGDGVVTFRVLHRDGDDRFVEVESRGLRDDTGTLLEIINVCHDVSEATRTRDALDASEDRFRHLFDTAPIGMALSGLDGRLWRVNTVYAHMLGYEPDDLVGRTVEELTPPEFREVDASNLAALSEGAALQHEVTKHYVHADGRLVPVVVHASLVQEAGDRQGYVMAHIVQAGPPE